MGSTASASGRVRSRKATQMAYSLAGVITEIRLAGIISQRGIAKALNRRHTPTARGDGSWTATGVKRLLARLHAAGAD
jgi:hypothetical protein